nr:phage tail tape measure protein [Nannocystis pusilla]
MKHSADAVKGFGTSVLSAIKGPVDKFKDFQEQMSSVKASTFDLTKTLDASQVRLMDAAMVDLAATARRLGSDTKYSASEAAAGMDILAKNFSGEDLQKAQDIMKAMPGILNTAAATRESIENAADIQTAAMNQFGLGAADMGRIGDVLVKTANGTATGLLDLGEALKYSGVTAAKANIDLETTLGMIGALGNAGKRGSVAGTGLASVLGNFQSGMKKQKGALAALGINIKDKQGNLRPIIELLAEAERAADKKFGKGKGACGATGGCRAWSEWAETKRPWRS